MRIGMNAPAEETVPPPGYGGTELVVNELTERLVRDGHEVVLFATADSTTTAELYPIADAAIRTMPEASDPSTRWALNQSALGAALEGINNSNLDVVHNNVGWQLLQFSGLLRVPIVTTVHGRLDDYLERMMYGMHADQPYVTISNSQARQGEGLNLNTLGTVYNGINTSRYTFNSIPEDYVLFLGRFCEDKDPVTAIHAARAAGKQLVMAAKRDPVDQEYFERYVEPLIDGDSVVYVGEVGHADKVRLLSRAKCLLVPLCWDEPFGMVVIEALACGTPVAATRRGSMEELLTPDCGVLCDSQQDMVDAITEIDKISRDACLDRVEQNFTDKIMADGYVTMYERAAA